MKAAQREPRETHRQSLLEELKGLFGLAFGPALEAYGRPFAERVGKDERFRKVVRDRFESGRALGVPPPANYSYKGDHAAVHARWSRAAGSSSCFLSAKRVGNCRHTP